MERTGYVDHVGLWRSELRAWVPETIFDAHVHLGPRDAMGPLAPDRQKLALSTFTSLTREELQDWYAKLFEGKRVVGLAACGFPLREADLETANRYLIRLMKAAPQVRGFLLAHPTDVGRSRVTFDAALAQGVRFAGVKPYFDLLGKGVFETLMPEFIPDALLEFMHREQLMMMLHTSGRGMGDAENQAYIRRVLDQYPRLRIVLAHMGRYIDPAEFFAFCESGLLEHPNLYLETSSVTVPEVYRRALERPEVRGRLLFGTDMPFGRITGVEAWSETRGPIFVTRDAYSWSDPQLAQAAGIDPRQLTYNTYHVIKALKDAIQALGLSPGQAEALKQAVFRRNAESLFSGGS